MLLSTLVYGLLLEYHFNIHTNCLQKNGFVNQAMSNDERIPPGYVPYQEDGDNSHNSRL